MSIWDSLSDKRSQQIESGTDITFNQFFVPYYRKTITEAKPRRLIDIGCGTGHLLLHLRELSEQLVGIEPSSGMINIAEKVLDKSGISLCQTRIQDFYAYSGEIVQRFRLIAASKG